MANENMSSKPHAGKGALVPFLFEDDVVRALERPDGDWFVASDVARVLGYRDGANALRILDDDEKGTHFVSTLGGPQGLLICSEPGLYKLIARSRKPRAKAFDRFVRHEVLPTIRRTGRFEIDRAMTKQNTQAMNAVCRAVGEVRRSQGVRAAARALPEIFRKAGIRVSPWNPEQPELGLDDNDPPEDD